MKLFSKSVGNLNRYFNKNLIPKSTYGKKRTSENVKNNHHKNQQDKEETKYSQLEKRSK